MTLKPISGLFFSLWYYDGRLYDYCAILIILGFKNHKAMDLYHIFKWIGYVIHDSLHESEILEVDCKLYSVLIIKKIKVFYCKP